MRSGRLSEGNWPGVGILKKFHLSSNHNLTCGTATTWMTEKLHRQNFCQSKTRNTFLSVLPITSFKIITITQYFNFPMVV